MSISKQENFTVPNHLVSKRSTKFTKNFCLKNYNTCFQALQYKTNKLLCNKQANKKNFKK